MKPVAIRKSRPVAVKKAGPQLQYDMQGKPSFVFGAGGGGGGGGGRSKRERALGAAGGLVGILGGALTPTRSLGGLLGGMYAGGAQGSAVAGGLGRRLTGRARQAQLDAREGRKQAEAEERGQLREDFRATGEKIPFFSRNKDQQRRRILATRDRGGKYDTAENQAARATREKSEAYFAPEARKLRYEQEQERQDMKVAVKDRAGVPARKPLMDITHQQELPNTAEARRIERIRNNEGATVTSAGGQGSPASVGVVNLMPHNQTMGEEDVTGPFADHQREGLEELPSQAKFREMSNELYPDARQELGIDPRPVQVTGQPADPARVEEEKELALAGGPQGLLG